MLILTYQQLLDHLTRLELKVFAFNNQKIVGNAFI